MSGLEATVEFLEAMHPDQRLRVPIGFNEAYTGFVDTGDQTALDALDWKTHAGEYEHTDVGNLGYAVATQESDTHLSDRTVIPVLERALLYSGEADAVNPSGLGGFLNALLGSGMIMFVVAPSEPRSYGTANVLENHEAYERLKGAEKAILTVRSGGCEGCARDEATMVEVAGWYNAVGGSIRPHSTELLERVKKDFPGEYDDEHNTILLLRDGTEVQRYLPDNKGRIQEGLDTYFGE